MSIAARYARLRGITVVAGIAELEDMAHQMEEFSRGRSGWYPPWDPESEAQRSADAAEFGGLQLGEATTDSLTTETLMPANVDLASPPEFSDTSPIASHKDEHKPRIGPLHPRDR